MSEQSELEVLVPVINVLDLRDGPVEILKIKTKHLLQVMEIAAPFYQELQNLKKKIKAQVVAGKVTEGEVMTLDLPLYELIVRHGGAVVKLIALLTDKDDEWVGELDLDELVEVFSTIIEVNMDFFIQKVLPLLTKHVKDIKAAIAAPVGGEKSFKA